MSSPAPPTAWPFCYNVLWGRVGVITRSTSPILVSLPGPRSYTLRSPRPEVWSIKLEALAETPQEPPGAPTEATEQPGRVESQASVEGHHMPSERERPWWRRLFGTE